MKYIKAITGACVGVIVSGAWLAGDLMLPEPWGDYLLFGSIALVTAGAGWKIGMFYEKQEKLEAAVRAEKAKSKV